MNKKTEEKKLLAEDIASIANDIIDRRILTVGDIAKRTGISIFMAKSVVDGKFTSVDTLNKFFNALGYFVQIRVAPLGSKAEPRVASTYEKPWHNDFYGADISERANRLANHYLQKTRLDALYKSMDKRLKGGLWQRVLDIIFYFK